MDNFKDIRAYRNGALLAITDWITIIPGLKLLGWRTTDGLSLDWQSGQKEQIEQDIKGGAIFLTNHRDIVLDPSWLTILLRMKYNIRPFVGVGNNLFTKWWIEPLFRFNHGFVVIRNGSQMDALKHAQRLSAYLHQVREHGKSIWLAQREGRAKDSNDLTQPAVLKMLTISRDDFLQSIREMNICPVSINYEYDPCDYLKAAEMQLKRDNPNWRKRKQDDFISMKTGIWGYKGRVIFRLTPSINHWLDEHEQELRTKSRNEQVAAVAQQIDKQIHANYEIFERGTDFEAYIEQQLSKINIPNKDEAFLREQMKAMYLNPVRNHQKAIE